MANRGKPQRNGSGQRADVAPRVIEGDARDAQAFVGRRHRRVDAVVDVRYTKTLRLIPGEVLEQKWFFEQALGRTDLLSDRGAQVGPSHGEVLPTRWIE